MAIRKIRRFAPYVYFAQKNDSEFFVLDLYVLIPVTGNRRIVFPGDAVLIEDTDTRVITCTVEAETDSNVVGPRYFRQHYRFRFGRNSGFDPSLAKFLVQVKDSDQLHTWTMLWWQDADLIADDDPDFSKVEGVALNCPYIHLQSTIAKNNKKKPSYRPQVLIPVLHPALAQHAEKLPIKSDGKGNCESVVALGAGSGDVDDLQFLAPNEINIFNFTRKNKTEGDFSAITYQGIDPSLLTTDTGNDAADANGTASRTADPSRRTPTGEATNHSGPATNGLDSEHINGVTAEDLNALFQRLGVSLSENDPPKKKKAKLRPKSADTVPRRIAKHDEPSLDPQPNGRHN